MIMATDVSHSVTEEGIAYLLKAEGEGGAPPRARSSAGVEPGGLFKGNPSESSVRKKGRAYPEDTEYIDWTRTALC